MAVGDATSKPNVSTDYESKKAEFDATLKSNTNRNSDPLITNPEGNEIQLAAVDLFMAAEADPTDGYTGKDAVDYVIDQVNERVLDPAAITRDSNDVSLRHESFTYDEKFASWFATDTQEWVDGGMYNGEFVEGGDIAAADQEFLQGAVQEENEQNAQEISAFINGEPLPEGHGLDNEWNKALFNRAADTIDMSGANTTSLIGNLTGDAEDAGALGEKLQETAEQVDDEYVSSDELSHDFVNGHIPIGNLESFVTAAKAQEFPAAIADGAFAALKDSISYVGSDEGLKSFLGEVSETLDSDGDGQIDAEKREALDPDGNGEIELNQEKGETIASRIESAGQEK
jgi:hypothetical protein